MRLFTFQNPIVSFFLFSKGSYRAELKYSREIRSYTEDIANLNGQIPIWAFGRAPHHSNDDIRSITDGEFIETVKNGKLFEHASSEMSLKDFTSLSSLVLLEIEIEEGRVREGVTHVGGRLGTYVFGELRIEDVLAVYALSYAFHFNSPVVSPVAVFGECTFPKYTPIGEAKKLYDRVGSVKLQGSGLQMNVF